MIQAIIFDLGNVLIPFDWKRGYGALAELCPHPPEEARRRIKESGLFNTFELGRIEPHELARRVCSLIDLDVSFERFRELWSSIFLPETNLPDSMLASLHLNYRLLLLSNTDAIHFGWVTEKYPLLRHFDHCVLSFELGCKKPAPKIYQAAIAQAGCPAPQVFFVDDIAENVEGARQLGIDALQFQSREQLEAEMQSRGIRYTLPSTDFNDRAE